MANVRNYGLFYKVGKRWIRLFPRQAYPKARAIRLFQTMLLNLFFRGKRVELRPIKVVS